MSPPIELTSVPPWALAATTPPADTTGRTYSIIAFGEPGRVVAAQWTTELGDRLDSVQIHVVHGVAAARAAFVTDLAAARVGWRLMVAGELADVMALRADALAGGLADDEITIATTATDVRPLLCSHCSRLQQVATAIGDVVACDGCGRNLLMYHHVSRRRAAFLGFMVDAEVWEA